MKCPRCETELPGKIRTGRTCWKCQQRFALEPKYTRGLHDRRLRRSGPTRTRPAGRPSPGSRASA